jgi:uncharacterized protein (TIGR00297 family)
VRWLSGGGVIAAVAVGGAVTAGLGWRGLMPLFAFFVSGSLLTQASGGSGGRRTIRQVLANGGVAAFAAALGHWPAAAGALAAATADTWATEIGAFSPRPPRSIATGAPVSAGASGGITLLGTAGGILGAIGIAALAGWLFRGPVIAAAAIAVAGVAGMLVDSWLGATVQGLFECPACGAQVERGDILCHEPVQRIRGWPWLDNNSVNLAATLVGAGLAAAGWQLLR